MPIKESFEELLAFIGGGAQPNSPKFQECETKLQLKLDETDWSIYKEPVVKESEEDLLSWLNGGAMPGSSKYYEAEWKLKIKIAQEKASPRRKNGILVIFFDDMKGSTALREKLGEQVFQAIKDEHDKTLTDIITKESGGEVIKSTGDGLLAVFYNPSTAVRRAIEIQEKLHRHPHISVKIGIDMGEVTIELIGGVLREVSGRHVDRAHRAMTLADAGHICVTNSVYDNALHRLSDIYITWQKHGLWRVKEEESPFEVYEPYNPDITQPMDSLRGEKVENEVTSSQKDAVRATAKSNQELCEDDIKVLKLIADANGELHIFKSDQMEWIRVGNKDFVENEYDRILRVVENLIEGGYVRKKSENKGVKFYRITDRGYKAIGM